MKTNAELRQQIEREYLADHNLTFDDFTAEEQEKMVDEYKERQKPNIAILDGFLDDCFLFDRSIEKRMKQEQNADKSDE